MLLTGKYKVPTFFCTNVKSGVTKKDLNNHRFTEVSTLLSSQHFPVSTILNPVWILIGKGGRANIDMLHGVGNILSTGVPHEFFRRKEVSVANTYYTHLSFGVFVKKPLYFPPIGAISGGGYAWHFFHLFILNPTTGKFRLLGRILRFRYLGRHLRYGLYWVRGG